MVERGRLIELIGTTITGKTTFAKELGDALGATVLLETAEGNPHMADPKTKCWKAKVLPLIDKNALPHNAVNTL